MTNNNAQQPMLDLEGGPAQQVDVAAMPPKTQGVYGRNLSIVHEVADGASIKDIASRHGLSAQWVRKIVRRHGSGGVPALVPKSRAPHTVANKTSDEVLGQVTATWKLLSDNGWDAGAESVRAWMLRKGMQAPSVSTIHRHLKRLGCTKREPHKRTKASMHRFAAFLPNETWQSDYTHWKCADGTDARIQTWLDDHSRMVLYSKAFDAINALTVLDSFLQACAEHGVPASTLTDNGREYTPGHDRGDRGKHPFCLCSIRNYGFSHVVFSGLVMEHADH